MELKKLSAGSEDLSLLEEINTEAIPEYERNSLEDMLATGADVIGIYDDITGCGNIPCGFLATRRYKGICYLAYLAVERSIRSKGLGGYALKKLADMYPSHCIVVEYEAADKDNTEDMNYRRKQFYLRNGFRETGFFTFYDDTEFEIACAGKDFDIASFEEFTVYLSGLVSDHIPKPYRKT